MTGKEKPEEEEDIIAIGDDEEPLEDDASDDEEESRLGASEEDDEEDGEEDDDEDGIKVRRRDERKTRRQRQKEAKQRNQTELTFLRSRNDQLERRFTDMESRMGAGEVQQIDAQINKIRSQIKLADQVIAKAVDQNKGSDLVEAQGIRDTLRQNLGRIEYAKNQLRARPAATNKVDAELMGHAEKWISQNSWWDANGGDEDSAIVTAIDNALAKEGFDPRTAQYWKELDSRVKRRLPERFKGNGKRTSNGGPRFRTGGRERNLGKNEVYISADRKQAMVEAGAWEDPVLRQRMLKQYASYDRANSD